MLGVVFCAIELLRKTYKMLGTHLTSSSDLPFSNFWTKKIEIFVTLKIYSVWNPDTLRSDTRKTSDTLKKLTRGFGPFFILLFNCQYGIPKFLTKKVDSRTYIEFFSDTKKCLRITKRWEYYRIDS